MAVGRRYDYTASVIGDCGHVCAAWPQFGQLGSSRVEIRCEICTREKYGISDDETLAVYVTPAEKPAQKEKPKKATAKKAVRCSICQGKGHLYSECPLLVGQGELFDGD